MTCNSELDDAVREYHEAQHVDPIVGERMRVDGFKQWGHEWSWREYELRTPQDKDEEKPMNEYIGDI